MGTIDKTVDADSKLTVYTASGEVSGADIIREVRVFYENGATRDVLWDLTNADLRQVGGEEIKGIAKLPRKHFDSRTGGKTALVVSSDFAFGLSRMYELQTNLDEQPFVTNIFRTLQEARDWLAETSEE